MATQGVVFHHQGSDYRTTGKNLNSGGMGDVFLLARSNCETGELDPVVGKVFHSEYLYQLRTDEVTRADHDTVQKNLRLISELTHPNILPTLVAEPIADNYLTVTPLKNGTLLEAIHNESITPRRRVEVLIGALHGLAQLHERGFIHRDFTLRNILVDDECTIAYVFDFDLTLSQSEVIGSNYKERYKGRIFGSPGYSVPPEILDSALMESSITTKLDIYAIGGAIFGLFTDELPYGQTEDMWALLFRISEGVVFGGRSEISYPDAVPEVLRPIIDGCLERDPGNRYGSVSLVIGDLERALPELSDGREKFPEGPITAVRYVDASARIDSVHASRREHSITKGLIEVIDQGLSRHGYHIQSALGRVKGYPIFLAAPDPELIAQGRFQDTNHYPKIVTTINLSQTSNRDEVIDLWMGAFVPILRTARTGLLTSLYRVVHDEWSGFLFLFSEYVADARFGTDLGSIDLSYSEAFGLGLLLGEQIRRLHVNGMAHNNVGAQSLVLKGIKARQEAWPAMIGIVAPSLEPKDMTADVRRLGGLIYSWLNAESLDHEEPNIRMRLDDVRQRIANIAYGEHADAQIDDALSCFSDGLATVDYNFGVLRANEGDLAAYSLLLIGRSLYSRLW